MEHLKKIYAQLRDLFLSMTPGNRIIATLLFFLLIVSLGFLIVGSVQPGDPAAKNIYLYDGRSFSPSEKQAVENALAKGGYKAHEWVGDKLRAPKAVASAYTAQIATEKAISDPGFTQFDMAKNLTPWESAGMKDEKMFQAKAVDVAAVISAMPGIASARITPNKRVEWDRNVWARKTITSVAVNIETVSYRPLEDNVVSGIGQYVAMAFGITDLKQTAKEISIIDSKNSRVYNGLGQESGGGGGSYLKEQVKYQELWKNKIYNILPYIQGLQVETSVDLTRRIDENIFEVEHVKPKAPLHEHVRGTDFLKEDAARFGRPGQIAQMSRPLIDPTAGQAEKARTTEKTHEKEITNPLAGKEERYAMIPLIPIRIFASLQIPRKHVAATWLQKNSKPGEAAPEPTPEQLLAEEELIRQDVKRLVAKLLENWWDKKSTPDPLEMVEVNFYDPILEPEIELTSWQKIQLWLGQNWQNLSLMGLVLCGLCVLWTITKPAKPDPIVIHEAPEVPLEVIEAHARAKAEEEAAAAGENEEGEEFNRTLDGFDRSIRSLQEEIADLVEENPEAAAAVLRQWIGNIVPVEGR